MRETVWQDDGSIDANGHGICRGGGALADDLGFLVDEDGHGFLTWLNFFLTKLGQMLRIARQSTQQT